MSTAAWGAWVSSPMDIPSGAGDPGSWTHRPCCGRERFCTMVLRQQGFLALEQYPVQKRGGKGLLSHWWKLLWSVEREETVWAYVCTCMWIGVITYLGGGVCEGIYTRSVCMRWSVYVWMPVCKYECVYIWICRRILCLYEDVSVRIYVNCGHMWWTYMCNGNVWLWMHRHICVSECVWGCVQEGELGAGGQVV